MLETAERLVIEDKEPALQQFLLLVGALRAICDTGRSPSAGPRLLPAALAGGRRLRADLRGVRAVRARGAAPVVQPGRRRHALLDLPGARRRRARRRRRWWCSARCSPATGRSSTPASHGTAGRRPAWSRRTCSGTSSAGSSRSRTCSGERSSASSSSRSREALNSSSSRAERRSGRASGQSVSACWRRARRCERVAVEDVAALGGEVEDRGATVRRVGLAAASPISSSACTWRVIVDGSSPNALASAPSRCGPSSASLHMIP